MLSYGNRNGTIGKLIYEDGKLTGISDRNDNQVIWFEYNDDDEISAVYDAENRRVEYSYTDGKLTSVTDVFGQSTTYEYDSKGRMIGKIDAAGRPTIITYDSYGNVLSVVDQNGNGYLFEFDYDEGKDEAYARISTSSGMVKEVWYDRDGDTRRVDINGRTVRTITKDGRNLIIIDEKGNVTRKDYDEWDNVIKITYPDGPVVTYEYEHKFNKKTRKVDENGNITEYEYESSGNLVRKVEASGTGYERITEYGYDSNGNLISVRHVGDAKTQEALTSMEYDDLGNLISITDPEGNITRYTSHDIMGNVLSKTDARGKVWSYEYDPAGRLIRVNDPAGNQKQFFYDSVGNKVREIDEEGKEKLYEYDDHNNLVKVTDALGNEILYEYNTDGKLVKRTDAEGKIYQYVYDSEGRLTKTIDGNGNEILIEYDGETGSGCSFCGGFSGENRPSGIIYPTFEKKFTYDSRGRKTEERDLLSDGGEYITSYSYDGSGNLVTKTDEEGKTTTYEYDALNRLIKVTGPMGNVTEYGYDDRDNLLWLKDANGNITEFLYDRNNKLVKETRPMGEETTYQYDAAGNLVRKTDAKNQVAEYIYDDVGRLVEIRYYTASDHVNPVKTTSFTYDKVGNLKSYDDGTTSGTFVYDAVYRKTSETVNYGPLEKSCSYAYYKNGLKKSFTGPDGVVYSYTYDANNQLVSVNIRGAGSITVNSYTWNRPTEMTLPGGSKKTFEYDPLMRVKRITAKDPGQNIIMDYKYTYDKMDNILGKITEHGNYSYGYDDLYRLTTVDNPDLPDEAFTYDPVGNRLLSAGISGNWTYNADNELLGYDGVSYEYDSNGNTIQKNDHGVITEYSYDIENRLVEVTTNKQQATTYKYYYDPFGRRLWKEVDGTRTYFMYSDEGLVAELDSSGNIIKSYGYRPNSTWTTDPLFMKEGNEYYFYHNDHLGTPQKLTAVNGAVAWSAKYASFGEATINHASTIINNLRFPGQYEDEKTGLHYNYHRFYDPRTGRYLTPDPIGLNGGISVYLYVWGDPTNLVDPMGLIRWRPCDEKSCIDKCLRDNYGSLYDVMKGLSIYGAFF